MCNVTRGASRRKSTALLAAAGAAIASIASTTAHTAYAGFRVELYATSWNGLTGAITDPKNVYFAVPGDTITFNVVGHVSGTNSIQSHGNYDGAAPPDTRNDDSIMTLVGAFSSVGPLLGDFDSYNQGAGNVVPPFNTLPFSGASQDLDSDGDLDLGSLNNDEPEDMWIAHSANGSVTAAISTRAKTNPQTRFGVTVGDSFQVEQVAPNSGVSGTRIVDATTADVLLGELTFVVTAGEGNYTDINFIRRPTNLSNAALWYEDGALTGKFPEIGSFTIAPPVRIGIPEPSTTALLGIASLGLLAPAEVAHPGRLVTRLNRLKSRMLLAAAAASVGVMNSAAQGGLVVELYATSINGSTVAVTNPKLVQVTSAGDVITFNIVARITGTDQFQQHGNFDNASPNIDTRNDEALDVVIGSFSSVGALLGDFDPGNQGQGSHVAAFLAIGSSDGVGQDFDSDGDLDVGSLANDPDPLWACRALNVFNSATVSKRTAVPQTRFGVSAQGASGVQAQFIEDQGGPNAHVPATRILDADTSEILIGELTWYMTTGAIGDATNINYIPRTGGDQPATPGALWSEDGQPANKTPANGQFGPGAPVTIVAAAIPEPATPLLGGLLAPALLARRLRD